MLNGVGPVMHLCWCVIDFAASWIPGFSWYLSTDKVCMSKTNSCPVVCSDTAQVQEDVPLESSLCQLGEL